MKCAVKGCASGNDAVLYPELRFHPPGGPITSPATAILKLPTCTECVQKTKVSDLLDRSGIARFTSSFIAMGRVVPDFGLTEIAWMPIAAFDFDRAKAGAMPEPDRSDN